MIAVFPESFSPTNTLSPLLNRIMCSVPSKHLKLLILNSEMYMAILS